MAHLVSKCHLGMHINYSLIKQCYDTVLHSKLFLVLPGACPPQTFEHDRSPCCTMSKTTCHLPHECTWRILMLTHFRRSIRCFNNKLIHDLSL